LASLVERLAEVALLLVGTYRPGYQPAWGGHTVVTQVPLSPLHPQDSRIIVQAVSCAVTLPEARLRAIVAQAGGNPFFVEELAWHAVEQGGGDTPGAVPETIHAVLAARMDRLPLEVKCLLQTAAVIGVEVPVALLQALAECAETPLHHGLAYMQTAELLAETRLFPEPVYRFKHALTHEVAYSSLLQAQRRALHARLVEILEMRDTNWVAGQVERLAHHALRGEVWDKAVTYCQQAGEKAMVRSAHHEAVGYFEQALCALPYLPETHDTCEQAIDLRLALRSALHPSGDLGRAMAYLREAETLAAALDDPRRLGQVSVSLSLHFYLMGAYDQAIAAAQRALVLATRSGEAILRLLANLHLGIASQAQGDYRRAIDCLWQIMTSLDSIPRHERIGEIVPAVFIPTYLAVCHAELGTFAEGRSVGDKGLQSAEAVDHPTSLMFALWGSGLLALRQGDLSRAVPRLERAVSLCQDAGCPAWFPLMAAALGATYTLAGRIADATLLLTQALAQTMATAVVVNQAICSLTLGEAQTLAGCLEEAHALAEGALSLARAHQERGNEAYALHLLGEIAVRRQPPERALAEAYYQQARTLAEELGMRPLQAHCHLGLGTLYATTGQRQQARTALTTAIDLYHTMEMTFWLPKAEAALAQVEG
jgi:tetratricopeptide (TPR) repeat protein